MNKRGLKLQCSHFIPTGVNGKDGRLPCVIYCHCNSGSRRDAEEVRRRSQHLPLTRRAHHHRHLHAHLPACLIPSSRHLHPHHSTARRPPACLPACLRALSPHPHPTHTTIPHPPQALYLLLPLGVAVFTMDFAGSGLSGGQYVTLGALEADDLGVAVKYLRDKAACSTLGLWGRSMGAVTALLYSQRDPTIAGMVRC